MRTAAVAAAALLPGLLSVAPASADYTPAGPTQLSAAQLPADLVTAIRRDLEISPDEYLHRAAEAQRLADYAQHFRSAHRGQYAGAWLTADGHATIGVTTPDAAKQVSADGFASKLQPISEDGLDGALTQLTSWMRGLPPTAAKSIGGVGIDVLNNQLVVLAANSPIGQALNLPTLVARVKVVLSPGSGGPIVHHPMGGDTYLSALQPLSVSRQIITVCSFGFNAVDAHGTAVAVSAGHCDPNLNRRDQSAAVYVPDIADVAASPQAGSFAKATLGSASGLDYSLITLNARAVRAGMDQPWVRGANGTTVQVTGVADPVVGAPVCKSGTSSAFTCGLVTGTQVRTTLQTDEGSELSVSGFATSACTLSGDSGGSIVSGTLALGITSGSNSSAAPDCNSANLGLALDGGTASLGIPVRQILADADASSGGGLGSGLRLRTADIAR